jgi:hypothetical protein
VFLSVLIPAEADHPAPEFQTCHARSPPDIPDNVGMRPNFSNVLWVAVKLRDPDGE